MSELLPVDWDVVLVHPIGVEDGPLQGLLVVDVGEVSHGNLVNVLHRPTRENYPCLAKENALAYCHFLSHQIMLIIIT